MPIELAMILTVAIMIFSLACFMIFCVERRYRIAALGLCPIVLGILFITGWHNNKTESETTCPIQIKTFDTPYGKCQIAGWDNGKEFQYSKLISFFDENTKVVLVKKRWEWLCFSDKESSFREIK